MRTLAKSIQSAFLALSRPLSDFGVAVQRHKKLPFAQVRRDHEPEGRQTGTALPGSREIALIMPCGFMCKALIDW